MLAALVALQGTANLPAPRWEKPLMDTTPSAAPIALLIVIWYARAHQGVSVKNVHPLEWLGLIATGGATILAFAAIWVQNPILANGANALALLAGTMFALATILKRDKH